MTALPTTRAVRASLIALGLTILGALAGLAVGLSTDAHAEVAGTDAAVRIHLGRSYDQLDLNGVLSAQLATDRSLLGEPLAVSIRLELDASTFVTRDGTFNVNVLPAYIQAYSDPDQIATDVRWGVTKHLLSLTGTGAALGLAVFLGAGAYRRWRRARDEHTEHAAELRRSAIVYWSPERALARRLALAAGVIAVLSLVPSELHHPPPPATITADPILADTPLAGAQVGGLLHPALEAVESYVQTYFADTNTYYERLREKLDAQLATGTTTLPSGSNVVRLGFVTDRHCNIGMDRVIVDLLDHFDVKILVSAGDDDFSGSFAFESVCTKNLAAKSQQAGMTDVFAAGNHDSATTIENERQQGVRVLVDKPVTVDGLTFIGSPDPRSSRYGEGLQPASETERTRLIAEQGQRAGERACTLDGPVIVVLHDPRAGNFALQHGCGKAVTALDGHTHRQTGPLTLPLPDGSTGYQFVGGSSGGAPGEGAIERNFASRLTVGPLNHDAYVNIVSIDRTSGAIVGVTAWRFTPQQDITFEQVSTG